MQLGPGCMRRLLCLGLAFAGLPLALSLTLIPIVSWRATASAEGRPYCLQVHARDLGFEDDGYRTVRSLTDLSGHRLSKARNEEGLAMSFHAVLVVEAEPGPLVYNWSFRRLAFEARQGHLGRIVLPRSLCEPRPRFIETLPFLNPS